jgi:hypothetical protein
MKGNHKRLARRKILEMNPYIFSFSAWCFRFVSDGIGGTARNV